MRFFVLLFTFVFHSNYSFATITITDITSTTVSLIEKDDEGKVFTKFFGGIATPETIPTGGTRTTTGCLETEEDSASTTCNTCVDGLFPCSLRRIYPRLPIQLTYTFTRETGYPRVEVDNESDTTTGFNAVTLVDGSSSTSAGTITIRFTWGSVCDTCTKPEKFKIRIGITANSSESFDEDPTEDKDYIELEVHTVVPDEEINKYKEITSCADTNTGICDYTMYPGDEKLTFDAVRYNTGGFESTESVIQNGNSTGYNVTITHIRAFLSTTSLNEAKPGATNVIVQDVPLSENWSFDEPIDGLTNGTRYFVRLSLLDAVGNNTFLGNDALLQTLGCSLATPDVLACKASGTPDPVLGLLAEDVNCFIATAAYGSILDQRIDTFRAFRNKFLLRKPLGLYLTKIYYKYGHQAAGYIRGNNVLRTLTRGLLWPLLFFAELSLKWGLFLASFFYLVLFSFFALFVYQLKRRRKKYV